MESRPACALHHLKHESVNPSIYQEAKSTVEIRQFPCPQTAQESKVVNEFIIAILEYLLKCQQNKETIDPLQVEIIFDQTC